MDKKYSVVEEDEEVILETSPLSQYLQEVGMTDISTFTADSPLQATGTERVPKISGTKLQMIFFQFVVCLSACKEIVFRLFTVSAEIILAPLKYLENRRLSFVTNECFGAVDMLLSSNIFAYNDEAALFKKYYEEANLTGFQENGTKWSSTNISFQLFGFIVLVVATVAAVLQKFSLGEHEIFTINFLNIFFGVFLLLSCTIPIFFIVKVIPTLVDYFFISSFRQKWRNSLSLLHDFNLFIDKSILLMKEVEVVSMGFLYPHGHASIVKVDAMGERFCNRLRHCLLCTSTEFLKELLRCRRDLDKSIKDSDICHDVKSDYFTLVSCDNLDNLFNSLSKHGEVQNATSLPTIKSYVNFFRFVFLELAKLIVILLSSEIHIFREKRNVYCTLSYKAPHSRTLMQLSEVVVPALMSMNSRIATCQEVLKFTQKYPFGYEEEKEEFMQESSRDEKCKLVTVVHGTELHFQLVVSELKRMSHIIGSNQTLSTSELCSLLEPYVLTCERNVMSGNICMDELKEILGKLHPRKHRDAKPDTGDNTRYVTTKGHLDESEHMTQLFPQINEIEGDKLFEGVSEPQCEKTEANALSEPFSDEMKAQMQASKRVLRELRLILSHKESPVGLVSFEKIKEIKNDKNSTECETMTLKEEELDQQKKRVSLFNEGTSSTDTRQEFCTDTAVFLDTYHSKGGSEVGQRDYCSGDSQSDMDNNVSYIGGIRPFSFEESFSKSIFERSKLLNLQEDTFGADDSDDEMEIKEDN